METEAVEGNDGKYVKELEGRSRSRVRDVDGSGNVFSKELSLAGDALESWLVSALELD